MLRLQRFQEISDGVHPHPTGKTVNGRPTDPPACVPHDLHQTVHVVSRRQGFRRLETAGFFGMFEFLRKPLVPFPPAGDIFDRDDRSDDRRFVLTQRGNRHALLHAVEKLGGLPRRTGDQVVMKHRGEGFHHPLVQHPAETVEQPPLGNLGEKIRQPAAPGGRAADLRCLDHPVIPGADGQIPVRRENA